MTAIETLGDATTTSSSDTRLIERWLPIAALGIESTRERTPMTPFPAPNRLHVWWARRPLVASRAAILASLLPADADRDRFLHALGIHGDPVAARRKIDMARRTGVRVDNPYTWDRAFSYSLSPTERAWLGANSTGPAPVVLDPTAGGGAIPFEAARLGLTTLANDLNPVAALILKATVEFPMQHGAALRPAFDKLATEFRRRVEQRLAFAFPQEDAPNQFDMTYLWARTIHCPHCDGVVPLSPSWRLAPDGTGVRIVPHVGTGPGDASRHCTFQIVSNAKDQSPGTVSDGDGLCCYPDCKRVIVGDVVKSQAQSKGMGEQLFAVVFKRRVETRTKTGKKGRDKWERGYRAPRPNDSKIATINAWLTERKSDWEALGYLPTEEIGHLSNYDRGHKMYGMRRWSELFTPRQLIVYGTCVEVYREILRERESSGSINDLDKAAFIYLSLGLDKMADYNSRISAWHGGREVLEHTFRDHAFVLKWAFAEMAPLVEGTGLDWAISATKKCINELVELARPEDVHVGTLLGVNSRFSVPAVTVTCSSAEQVRHISDAIVDIVVMDPPYYDNVMYAELSDFFYVWLKRTAGEVLPELFTRKLTDKDNEAVANPAKFADQKGVKALAGRDYQQRMARIFEECRRVLKPNGIMTLMFTHKATGAWDALTKGLMEAGFVITASWPINTEAEGSLHIKDKSAANSTIFLVCRPREAARADSGQEYWEDVEPLVARAVRRRVEEFQKAGIGGVDLYLACFGPALEEFSRHWPLKRGTPRPTPEAKKRQRQHALFEEEWDPYAVTPEDALDAARREVKQWRLEQLAKKKAPGALDPLTSFFVLAWDAFKAPLFPYDEGLRLARAVGVDLDRQIVGVLAEKKGSDLLLWDSGKRAAKAALGAPDGSRAMIDALHHVANAARGKTLAAAKEMAERAGLLADPGFRQALTYVLEVLPPSRGFTGVALGGDVGAAASDFEALENLRRLALADQVPEPEQLKLFALEMA
jgi:putative DNA methylase